MSGRRKTEDGRRGGTAPAFGILLLIVFYASIWAFRIPLGLVRPAANLAYVTYSDSEAADRALHALFWPCSRITGERHVRFDRVWIAPEEQGP